MTFADCKLDDANLRLTKLQRVRFASCVLAGAELVGAQLEKVAFPASDLAGANLSSTHCVEVDLRGARLDGMRGVASLAGATIGTDQLIGSRPHSHRYSVSQCKTIDRAPRTDRAASLCHAVRLPYAAACCSSACATWSGAGAGS